MVQNARFFLILGISLVGVCAAADRARFEESYKKEHLEYGVKTINDIPRVCAHLIKSLAKEPRWDGTCAKHVGPRITSENRVFLVDSSDICHIFCTIHRVAQSTGLACGDVASFGKHDKLKTREGRVLEQGLVLTADAQTVENIKKELLLEHYTQVLMPLSKGWKNVTSRVQSLKGTPCYSPKDDASKYELLIKSNPKGYESSLIVNIASHLNFKGHIICSDTWQRRDRQDTMRGSLYMWIRKDSYEEMCGIFGITLG